MNNQDVKVLFNKIGSTIAEIGSDLTVGFVGVNAAISMSWIEDIHNIILAVISTCLCGAAWHYFKQILKWFDTNVFKFKK